MFLACQNILDFDIIWKLIAPVIIAVIGIKMIFGGIGGNREFIESIEAKGDDIKTGFAVFSGQDIRFDNRA